MLSFRRYSPGTRASALLTIAFAAVALGACTMPANNGFTQARADAQPFAAANSACWETAMGAHVGGSSQFGGQMAGYDSCMARAGWERPKSMF
jgi:hypothetical protein